MALRRSLAVVMLVLCLGIPGRAAAQDAHDSGLWVQMLATLRLSENWRLHLEAQPRWYQDWSEAYQVLTRTGLGRRLGRRASVWGGYAWVAKPPGEGVTDEHRIWEQLSTTFPAVARWTPSMRVRLEQRFQDTWTGSSHRLRLMGRGARPFDERARWSLATWDELLVTLDHSQGGPGQGVDHNRLFAGVLRQFTPKVGLEVGYLWVTSKPRAGGRTHVHNTFVWLNLTP